uniref:Uncharacterized protein n=1 Tax=Cucumis sativus TaxID=3659 RepID=A0A0A0L7F4_CUCSA
MVRAPCCEKMGLKKGPWTPEEDQTLINYINLYGHGNWRALPKQAGLLRCGKSCRLRWTNYLRPDIKRGNFTAEEEETIINLHQMLGNSESSSIITAENGESWTNNLPEADENFWREVLGSDQMATVGNQQGFEGETSERQLGNLTNEQPTHETTDFWTIFFQEEGIYLS